MQIQSVIILQMKVMQNVPVCSVDVKVGQHNHNKHM